MQPAKGSDLLVSAFAKIGRELHRGDGRPHEFADLDLRRFRRRRLVKTFTDSVRLWVLRLGPGMIDILQCEIELIFVMLGIAAIFGAAIGQNT